MEPVTTAALISGGTSLANTAGSFFGQRRQHKYNRRYADHIHRQNMELLKYQLDYNSPASQMARFKEAGLNPNLVYGQGSPGNMDSAPKYPDMQPPDMMSAYANIGTQIQQARLMHAQTANINQRTVESGVKQELMKAQRELVKANPYLNKAYMNSFVGNMISVAELKGQQASFMTQSQDVAGDGSNGWRMMTRQMELLDQRFKLGQQDQAIRAEIFQSKAFQNELLKIQTEWMKDGSITPQHIFTFVQMLMGKIATGK